MNGERRQAGSGRIGCILWAALVLVGALIAWKAIPVKIAVSELQDFMVEQAKFAARSSNETIQGRIVRKANDLDLPIEKKNVKVAKSSGRIRMEVNFTVPLEFPGYVYYWDFDIQVDRPIFIF